MVRAGREENGTCGEGREWYVRGGKRMARAGREENGTCGEGREWYVRGGKRIVCAGRKENSRCKKTKGWNVGGVTWEVRGPEDVCESHECNWMILSCS